MIKVKVSVFWRPRLGTVINGIELNELNAPLRRLVEFETRGLTEQEFKRLTKQIVKLQDRYGLGR